MIRKAPEAAYVVVVNPLGGTLHHYTEALRQLLIDAGGTVEVISFDEPSVRGTRRARWLLHYIAVLAGVVLRSRPRSHSRMVVTWPVLGYWDFLFLAVVRATGIRPTVVLHDPEPLVHAVGYSKAPRKLARLLFPNSGLIVHSQAAQVVVDANGMGGMTSVLPHPVLRELLTFTGPRSEAVRVLGQYKPDRDVRILESIGHAAGQDAVLEIWGRGWPRVEGWDVHEGFVSEERLNELIHTSSAVVIPYRRFYQSGIAIRALECGVPFVGPQDSSLSDLYDSTTGLLVSSQGASDGASWWSAIRRARSMSAQDLERAAQSAFERASKSWSLWLGSDVPNGKARQ